MAVDVDLQATHGEFSQFACPQTSRGRHAVNERTRRPVEPFPIGAVVRRLQQQCELVVTQDTTFALVVGIDNTDS
ncbi:MAG: hypothetical protein R3C10_03960 [Pirellulales bacterium]